MKFHGFSSANTLPNRLRAWQRGKVLLPRITQTVPSVVRSAAWVRKTRKRNATHPGGLLTWLSQRLSVNFDQLFELILERISQLGDVLEADHFFKGVATGQLGALDDHIVRRSNGADRAGQKGDREIGEFRQLAGGERSAA